MRVLEAALNAVWTMEENALEAMLEMLARDHDVTPEALSAYRAQNLKNARQATTRNGVAVLPVIGPTVKRANFFTEVCGGASYDIIRQDLQAALDDPKIKAILLDIDSPGGEASGAGELAQAIADARQQKPITAYVSGMAASAAYWIASAAGPGNVVIDATAILGSIGAQAAFKTRAPKAGEKSYRFVSSQSPLKNADPGTSEGAAQFQATVDAIGKVFVEAVAKHRGVATATVLSDFGKGGIFVGEQAIKAGLADRLGTFEGVLAELAGGRAPQPAKATTMSGEKIIKAQVDAALAAVTAASGDHGSAFATVVTPPTAAEIATQRAEAEALEADAIVARITGTPVAQLTAERHALQREASAIANARRHAAAPKDDLDAIAARIANA